MTYVQLLRNRLPFEKTDSMVFITNNPKETLRQCNEEEDTMEIRGLWDSRAILGPGKYYDMMRAGNLIVDGTRGYLSKFQKMNSINEEFNLGPLYIGDDTIDTDKNLNHSLCKRQRKYNGS